MVEVTEPVTSTPIIVWQVLDLDSTLISWSYHALTLMAISKVQHRALNSSVVACAYIMLTLLDFRQELTLYSV